MGTRMKTTVEIADALVAEAKEVAAREGTTLRELVEAGLRLVLQDRRAEGTAFRLRDARFRGRTGVRPGFEDWDWGRIREALYEGRGG